MFVHVSSGVSGNEIREGRCAFLARESEAVEPELLKLQKFSFAGKTFDNFFCAIVGFWLACLLFAIVARSERRKKGGERSKLGGAF